MKLRDFLVRLGAAALVLSSLSAMAGTTVGAISDADIETDLEHLAATLRDLGR